MSDSETLECGWAVQIFKGRTVWLTDDTNWAASRRHRAVWSDKIDALSALVKWKGFSPKLILIRYVRRTGHQVSDGQGK